MVVDGTVYFNQSKIAQQDASVCTTTHTINVARFRELSLNRVRRCSTCATMKSSTMWLWVCLIVCIDMACATPCVSYLRTQQHPFFPAMIDRTSCAVSYDDAMSRLDRRVAATCAMKAPSNLDALNSATPSADSLMPLTAAALLGMPLVIGFAEITRTNTRTSAPYVAFVTLACVLHLCVISALYAKPLAPTPSLYQHCCAGVRMVLRQSLCDGGAVIARIAPLPTAARGARAVGAFVAMTWTACAASVVRRYSIQQASEYGPLLAKWRR